MSGFRADLGDRMDKVQLRNSRDGSRFVIIRDETPTKLRNTEAKLDTDARYSTPMRRRLLMRPLLSWPSTLIVPTSRVLAT